jgi:hypothetical protein
MDAKLFGVPLVLWGSLCLILAVVWVIIWPHDRAATANGVRFFILRWFHALVWLLLAIAAFIIGLQVLGGAPTARIVALLALISYLIFMATLVTSR